MRISSVYSKSLVAAALVATSLTLSPVGSASAAPATQLPPSAGQAAGLQPTARPLNPPKGGTQLITYYSDAAHTNEVGQRTSTPCPSSWGVMTTYYVVTPVPC
jgi:hypothetical protein